LGLRIYFNIITALYKEGNSGTVTTTTVYGEMTKQKYDALPVSQKESDVNMEGSFISWGGKYADDATIEMKKGENGVYYKFIKVTKDVNSLEFQPSWVKDQSLGGNGVFKFKTGSVWESDFKKNIDINISL